MSPYAEEPMPETGERQWVTEPDVQNALVVAGALWLALTTDKRWGHVEVIDGQPAVWVHPPFMKSRYRITVEIDPEEAKP